jgi:hypothetical protein
MHIYNLISILLIGVSFQANPFTGSAGSYIQNLNPGMSATDTIKENQLLYIGKEWHNLYTLVKGHQFLFTNQYMDGSVTINGSTYNKLSINYDVYNDEIIARADRGVIVQLNKEMIDSFTLSDQFKTYRFINMRNDSLPGIGYVNVLYNKRSVLFIKYKKEIQQLAVDEKYDQFFRTSRIFLLSDGVMHRISGKKDLLNVFQENKIQIKDYMKKNKIKISKIDPESFVPVIRYYDNLRK